MSIRQRRAAMERHNALNDRRNRHVEHGKIDHATDELIVKISAVETARVPYKFAVCPTCQGKGAHVNPNIDSGGISAERFQEDPEFAANYFGGTYDQCCNECGGDRVVPVPDFNDGNKEHQEIKAKLEGRYEAERQHRAMVRAERRMGA